jgi:putative hydrolase of the HAD superfamily
MTTMERSAPAAVQLVAFDLDDTLFPERDYVRSGYHAAAEHLRRTRRVVQRFEDFMWGLFLAGQTAKVFDAADAHFELGLSPAQITELVEVYRTHVPAIAPYPGLAPLLSLLRVRFRLAVLSDGYLPAQRLKLEALKLGQFFDGVLFTEELGRDCWKPSPAGFTALAERLAVPAEACAYVADNPAKDFVAPNGLGWRTIQYLRPGQLHAAKPAPPDGQPGAIVHTPDGLLDALR